MPAPREEGSSDVPADVPEVGSIIDRRYALRREIARGGAAIVFEATHLLTTRSVAVKLLLEGTAQTADARARLLEEAKALTVARHPSVVQALDAGEAPNGTLYLVMELLEGRTLEGILTVRPRIGVGEVLRIGIELCDALATGHERGVIHRDVKPSNIAIARNDAGHEVAKLFDFGVAQIQGDRKLTQPNVVLGTPEYMAPEQLLGDAEVDHRCDIYALGVTLYQALAGVVPFEGNFGQVLLKASTEAVPPLSAIRPDVSPDLVGVIEKALARDPGQRFAHCRAFAAALARVRPPAGPQVWLLGIAQAPTPTATPSEQAELPTQRRRYPRAPYVTPIRILRANRTNLDGRTEDISVGGLLVVAAHLFEREEQVKVRFALPITGRMLELPGTARWIKSARGAGAVGFEFAELSGDAHAVIERYVAAMGGA